MDSFSSSEKKLDSSLPLSQTVIRLRFPTKCRSNKSQSKNLHKDTSFPGYQTMDSASEHRYFPTFSFSVQKRKEKKSVLFWWRILVGKACVLSSYLITCSKGDGSCYLIHRLC